MKRLLAIALSLLALAAQRDDAKLGGPTDSFRSLLFANQSLDDLLSRAKTSDTDQDSVWTDLKDTQALLKKGRPTEAARKLKEALGRSNLECRIRLWIWTALRSVGVAPRREAAKVVRGVVIEIPFEKGVEILAAYEDGTARYIDNSGGGIVWDRPDEKVTALCNAFLAEAQRSEADSFLKVDYSPPTTKLPILTLLTYGGNKAARTVPDGTFIKAAELLKELVSRASR